MQVSPTGQNRCLKMIILLIFLGLFSGCVKDDPYPPPAKEESANVVYDWYKLIIQIQLNLTPSPIVLQNNRDIAYVGVGLYESVHPGIKNSVSLSSKLYQMPAMPKPESHKEYLWGASANAFMASILRESFPNLTAGNKTSIDSLENAYITRFKTNTSDAVLDRSQAFGRSISTAISAWSKTDNFTLSSVGYTIPVFPGSWEPTPPARANPVGPFIKNSRPFLQSSLGFTSNPIAYSEDPASAFYKAAKEVYDIGKMLTADEKAIALWWADVGGVGVNYPGPGHIISIVTSVLEKQKARLAEAVEIYAKTGIVGKEGIYRVWKVKFEHNLLRPVTYINNLIDKTWLPFLTTPPYPDYPSGLAGLYTPTMQILTRAYGDIPVTDNTYSWSGFAPRHYASFIKLAEEAATSRLYGGIHYRWTQDATLEIGKQLGNEIADLELVPSKY
jgi:hypothetical protein